VCHGNDLRLLGLELLSRNLSTSLRQRAEGTREN
jgi:hypothetical protein